MNRALRLTCLIALPLALAACGKDKQPDAKAEAAGEILPGSIDDAMLPLDTVRSQPPLAPRPDAAAKGAAAKDGDEDIAEASDEAAAATDSDAAPAVSIPTATSAPTPAPAPKAP